MKKRMIIEAGGTNSQILIGKGALEKSVNFRGLNGNIHSRAYIQAYFTDLSNEFQEIEEIIFYGAGIIGEGGELIKSSIEEQFHLIPQIHSDLLAVCRALLGNSKGHCFILGTGANACYYDGIEIIENRSGHGIILGDEGSGAFIGRLFIQDILNKTVPTEIDLEFREFFKLSDEDIINRVYHGEGLSAWLGQFAKYIVERKEVPYFRELIEHNFQVFFDITINGFENKVTEMQLNGGFVFALKKEIEELSKDKGIKLGKVVSRSIDLLADYHFGKD